MTNPFWVFVGAACVWLGFGIWMGFLDRRKRAAVVVPEAKIVRFVRHEMMCPNCHKPLQDGQHVVSYGSATSRPMTHLACLSIAPEGMNEDDFKYLQEQAWATESGEVMTFDRGTEVAGPVGVGDLVQVVAGPWLGRSGSVVSVGEGTVVVWLGHARCFEPEHLKVISRGEPGAPLAQAAVGVPTATGSVARCKHGMYACECCGTTYVRDAAHTTDGGVGVVGKLK